MAERTPAGFTGEFSTMDALQRCKAGPNVVVCASVPSGQKVTLGPGGADYGGKVASFPAPKPLGLGTSITTASGITCENTHRGIECSRGGHGFVIGDRAVVVLRGPDEERFEADPEPAQEPAPEDPPGTDAEGTVAADDPGTPGDQVCYPGITIPETVIPAITIGGVTYPEQVLPATSLPETCFDSDLDYPALADTSVLIDGYEAIDPDFSSELSEEYWASIPAPEYVTPGFSGTSVPDYTAPGFGTLNDAGYPKNQYVRPYFRRDGTFVSGYWRNSPSDGYPTCRVITC